MNISSSAAYLFEKKLENFYFDIYPIVDCARGQYEANPVFWLASRTGKMGLSRPLGIGRVDRAKEKNCVEQTYQVFNSWTIAAIKSQKAAEDRQTKENITTLVGIILYYKRSWLVFFRLSN